jgi:hypothetical protein
VRANRATIGGVHALGRLASYVGERLDQLGDQDRRLLLLGAAPADPPRVLGADRIASLRPRRFGGLRRGADARDHR